VSQAIGDQATIFIIRGQWWPPAKPLTITLVGFGTSPVHPIVDDDGSFNYAINQDHEFFAGSIPAGTYTIRVTDRAGASALARFRVS
jgi:DNA-binding beta-propeller fold protein YncE